MLYRANRKYKSGKYKGPYGSHGFLAALPGFRDACAIVEGLNTLELITCTGYCCLNKSEYPALIRKLETGLRERMKEPRGTTKYSKKNLLMAQQYADLDLHGDGRLGEDKKPSVVSSRTRGQLRKSERIAEDGTIVPTAIAKYDNEGDLTVSKESTLPAPSMPGNN